MVLRVTGRNSLVATNGIWTSIASHPKNVLCSFSTCTQGQVYGMCHSGLTGYTQIKWQCRFAEIAAAPTTSSSSQRREEISAKIRIRRDRIQNSDSPAFAAQPQRPSFCAMRILLTTAKVNNAPHSGCGSKFRAKETISGNWSRILVILVWRLWRCGWRR